MSENQKDRFDQLLEFETLFPHENPLSPEEYLKGGNRSLILDIATFFLSFKTQNSKYHSSKNVLEIIFGENNNGFANDVYNQILAIEKKGAKVTIINPQSSLDLFEYFFRLDEYEQTQDPDEFEINFFKAYLVFNSRFTKEQLKAFSSTKDLEEDLHYPMMIFCSSYPYTDKVNYDINGIWITQVIKSVWFFEFLEKNKQTLALLEVFLNYFENKSWRDYLKKLLPLTTSSINNEKESQTDITVTKDEEFDYNISFIEKLILVEDDELYENDYLTLRSKPFYKIKEGVYRIIFNLFVVEKIFKGLYFILRDLNNKLPDKLKVNEFKSLYGLEFSEKTLLYRLMDLIYNKPCIKYTGEFLEKSGIAGAPDYYIRHGKNILLFESKDFLIPASSKMSFDFSIYEDAFEEKLYFKNVNGKEKPKAIMQLINVIKKLLKNNFSIDTNYKYREIYIYPIIITHDHQYDTAGFNTLINSWFQEELDYLQEKGFYINKIKPLVIINVDSLIYHQVPLGKSISIHELLDIYYKESIINRNIRFKTDAEAHGYFISKLVPFSVFLDRYVKKHNLREMPPIVNDIGRIIFNDEQ